MNSTIVSISSATTWVPLTTRWLAGYVDVNRLVVLGSVQGAWEIASSKTAESLASSSRNGLVGLPSYP